MDPIACIRTFFKSPEPPDKGFPKYYFDRISCYFRNQLDEGGILQTIDAQTSVDLDIDAVFERIDRTTGKVGQQCLYARLRILRGPKKRRPSAATPTFSTGIPAWPKRVPDVSNHWLLRTLTTCRI